jgi:ABC-type nitrate/sulfonate/bicarbonate transport system ATPase subunit
VSAEPKLRIEGVSRSFETAEALRPVDLAVAPGEFVSVVGPSGCGKSTLFNIISGILAPSAGRVYIDGRDVTGTTGHAGYMLQKDLLLPWRTVIENITLGAALHGRVPSTATSCCSTSRSARSTRRRAWTCSAGCSACGRSSGARSSSSPTTSTRRSSSPTAWW